MDKEKLLREAEKIKTVSVESIDEYHKKMDLLVAEVNALMTKRSDIYELIGGKENLQMMKDNHINHIRFVLNILQNFNSEQLVETVLWVFRAYGNRGFCSNYWVAQLNSWVKILKKELSEKTFNEIYPLYDWFIVNIPIFKLLCCKE